MVQVTELGYMGVGVKQLDEWKNFATQILGLQLPQGLAHWSLAHAQLPGEVVRPQAGSGLERVGNDRFAQHRIGGFRGVSDIREPIDELVKRCHFHTHDTRPSVRRPRDR